MDKYHKFLDIKEKTTHPLTVWMLNSIADASENPDEGESPMDIVIAELEDARDGVGWMIQCAAEAMAEEATRILRLINKEDN